MPVVLGLSLVACGASGDVAGDDWRTSGVVAGSGTITHDGESDVLVSFIDEYGDNTELIWLWDPVERYVFREDLSTIAIGESDQDAEQDMHLEADGYVGDLY